MELNSTTGHLNETYQLDLSSSAAAAAAATAFVFVSSLFCFALLFVYCRYYCNETRNDGPHRHRQGKALCPPQLPMVYYRSKGRAEELTGGCVICLSEFEEEAAVKVIPGCGHVFHPMCIDGWIVAHPSCPVCRCSKIFRVDTGVPARNDAGGEEVVGFGEVVEVGREGETVRLERSRSWCCRVYDEERVPVVLSRTCSF